MAAENYVCVRVTNMEGVDLSIFKFDFDLTFAVLLMNADGTIYHRYGNRDWKDASSRLSMDGLVKVMDDTLADHRAYMKNPKRPKKRRPRFVEQLWVAAKRGKKPNCFHCHMVGGVERDLLKMARKWNPDEIYKIPLPERVGITLDVTDQTLVTDVAKRSPAARVGLKKGDRLVRVNKKRIRTQADLSWELEHARGSAPKIPFEWERKGATKKRTMRLRKGWKKADPLDVSWRSTMWSYEPQPGFGGPVLKPNEMKQHGLKQGTLAFKVGYIVTWGNNRRYGANANKAGFRKGDIIFKVHGKNDFKTMQHYHAWSRLTFRPGHKVVYDVIRNGKRRKITMNVIR